MNIEVDVYKRLQPMRRLGEGSITRREPASKVVERLLDFYLTNGGDKLEAEYKLKELEEG